ncbi:hypothetical protein GWK47_005606 [Chionoecetes opilio]|uniref:Uncharacterized protein n=1 Tax=Chionoecetes opilio TaxID=41210 RepID=A0A8J4YFJ0_CHIOP|nr:hypothetical protein GWK47_005606 [Chionoecetes opilio]
MNAVAQHTSGTCTILAEPDRLHAKGHDLNGQYRGVGTREAHKYDMTLTNARVFSLPHDHVTPLNGLQPPATLMTPPKMDVTPSLTLLKHLHQFEEGIDKECLAPGCEGQWCAGTCSLWHPFQDLSFVII